MAKLNADIFRILRTKHTKEIDKIVAAALKNKDLREELLDGLTSTDDYYRYNCFRTMLGVTEQQPELVYPAWDRIAKMLGSQNSYHQNIAVCLLANLTAADKAKKFEKVFDAYFALLESEGMILARYVAQSAGIIARNKPGLRNKITSQLVAVEKSRQKQKELIKTDVINSFDLYFDESSDRESIVAFVVAQTKSSSPKTKKAANDFMKKWGLGK